MTTNKVCGKGKCKFTDEFCASGDCPYDQDVLKKQKKINISEGNVKEDDINVAQRNSQDLTEQWKKDELEDGEYYIKSNKGHIYIDICADGSFMFTNYRSIEEVLAPVPSYEQWQSLNELLDSMNDTNKALAHRLNICKELLKECNHMILAYSINHDTFPKEKVKDIVTKIEGVLK